MNLGEPIFSYEGLSNLQARNLLTSLFQAFARKAQLEGNQRLSRVVDSFNRFPYADGSNRVDFDQAPSWNDIGELGIVYTSIKLGEEE